MSDWPLVASSTASAVLAAALDSPVGAALPHRLTELRDLIDRSLADVRLSAGSHVRGETINLMEFVEEVQVSSAMEAKRLWNTSSRTGSAARQAARL